MVIRRIVRVLGAVIGLVGVSQIIWADWWLGVTRSVVETPGLRFIGLLVLAIGAVLAYAGFRRVVGLGLFVAIIGLLTLLGGALMLLNFALMKDFTALVLNRSQGFQVFWMRSAGIVRLAVGIALVYAAMRPEHKAAPEEPPLFE